MGKRTIWIAEAALFVIGVVAIFMGNVDIAMACVVAIAATMDKLVDNTPKT